MPTLSIWSIRISLIYLVAGMALGAVILVNKALSLSPALWLAIPLHVQCVLWGWTLQLVIGTAYWMLPTFGSRTNRGREQFAAASVILLNLGVILGLIASLTGWPLAHYSSLSISLAAISFAWHAWPRIKAFGK